MPSHSPSCPFCKIATSYPPIPPSSFLPNISSASSLEVTSHLQPFSGESDGQAHLVLSTKYVLAFLDIMPLTRGHLLLITREHCEKLGEVGVRVAQEVCLLRVWFTCILGLPRCSDSLAIFFCGLLADMRCY
jgi:Diadenosine tetraphosphate (Ap4A) hydrolase and other HIT family hydrolases